MIQLVALAVIIAGNGFVLGIIAALLLHHGAAGCSLAAFLLFWLVLVNIDGIARCAGCKGAG